MGVRQRLPGKKRRIIIAVLTAVLAIMLIGAASRIISNILTLGPTQLTLENIVLTTVQDLPASVNPNVANEARFEIENLGPASVGVSLKARITAGGQVLDATMATLEFEDPDTLVRGPVTLTAVGGNLEGTLKSNWSIPENYRKTASLWLTLNGNAPAAAYSIELWAEIGGASPTVRSFTLDAWARAFVGVSGTGADGLPIAGVDNPILKVNANEQVEITIIWQDSLHDIAVYTAPCPGGFCLDPIVTSPDVRSAGPLQATINFTAPPSGTWDYICDYHPGSMAGTIEVVP